MKIAIEIHIPKDVHFRNTTSEAVQLQQDSLLQALFVLSLFDLKAWKFRNFQETDASLSFNKECPILVEKLYFSAGIFAELLIAQKSSLFVVHAHHQFEKH